MPAAMTALLDTMPCAALSPVPAAWSRPASAAGSSGRPAVVSAVVACRRAAAPAARPRSRDVDGPFRLDGVGGRDGAGTRSRRLLDVERGRARRRLPVPGPARGRSRASVAAAVPAPADAVTRSRGRRTLAARVDGVAAADTGTAVSSAFSGGSRRLRTAPRLPAAGISSASCACVVSALRTPGGLVLGCRARRRPRPGTATRPMSSGSGTALRRDPRTARGGRRGTGRPRAAGRAAARRRRRRAPPSRCGRAPGCRGAW